MRIGLVSYEYPPQQGLGGVGTYMFRLAGALGMAGHDVHVIAGPSEHAPLYQPNVQLHRIPARHEIRTNNRALRWLYWQGFARMMAWVHPAIWHWLKWDFASHQAIQEIDSQHPFDLIEAPEHAANGWMAGRIHRWPIVIRMHCPWDLFVRINGFPFNPMNRVLSALERRTVAVYPDALTVPSEAMRHEVERSWRLRRPPMVVPNFMDIPAAPAPLPADENAATILCIGRIEPLKGQDTLAKAFALIAGRYPRARLRFLGPDRWPGKYCFSDLLQRMVPDAAIRERIDLPGAVPLSHVAQQIRAARVVVIPSRGFESFSYAALESLAAARPIVASTAGALRELIQHERSGLLVPPGDPVQLSAAIDRMLSDRRFAQDLGTAGHAHARIAYDTPRVLPKMMDAYQEAADFFYHVRAAGSERTALQYRRALDAARAEFAEESGPSSTPPDHSRSPRLWVGDSGSDDSDHFPKSHVA